MGLCLSPILYCELHRADFALLILMLNPHKGHSTFKTVGNYQISEAFLTCSKVEQSIIFNFFKKNERSIEYNAVKDM